MIGSRAFAACGDNVDDRERVATIRQQAESQCDCGGERRAYIRCVRGVVSTAIDDGYLPRSCGSTVMRCDSTACQGSTRGVRCSSCCESTTGLE